MDAITSQITNHATVFSIVYSGADQGKHQSSVSLDFVQGIHRRPVNFPHKGPVTRKMVPFDDIIMSYHTQPSLVGSLPRNPTSWSGNPVHCGKRSVHGPAHPILRAVAPRIGRAWPWTVLSCYKPEVHSTNWGLSSAHVTNFEYVRIRYLQLRPTQSSTNDC